MTEGSEQGGGHQLDRQPVADVSRERDAVVVRLAGELDLYNAEEVRAALLELVEEQPQRLVVDLSEVEFVDSTVLGVLVEARSKMANRAAFMLAAPGLETQRALRISGLDRHLNLHETLAAALDAPV